MGLLSAFSRSPGFNPLGGGPLAGAGGGMTNQAAPNQMGGMGALQDFMAQLPQGQQGSGWIKPPALPAWVGAANGNLGMPLGGGADPSTFKQRELLGQTTSDQFLGYGDMMGHPGVATQQPAGFNYGTRMNTIQGPPGLGGGYSYAGPMNMPAYDQSGWGGKFAPSANPQQPSALSTLGNIMTNPFGSLMSGLGSLGGSWGGGGSNKGNLDDLVLKKMSN